METNKTAEIFNLAVAGTITNDQYGLPRRIANHLAGYADQHAETEEEFVKEVLSQAEVFTTSIESLIEIVEAESLIETVESGDSESNEADLKLLKEMLSWTFDAKELEKMAREDWAENHNSEAE